MGNKRTMTVVGIVCVMVTASAVMAGLIQYDSNPSSWIHARESTAGTPVYVQDTESILFYDVGPDAIYDTADDVIMNPPGPSGGTWNGEGWLQGQFVWSTDVTAYGRVIDRGFYYDLDVQSLNFPIGNEINAYSFTGTPTTGGGWTAIPEPCTMALFGVGLLTLAARKRIRK